VVESSSDLNPHSKLVEPHRRRESTILFTPTAMRVSILTGNRLLMQARPHRAQPRHRLLPKRGSCGHFASKSRRYSTTLGAIRGERRAYHQRQAAEHARELVPEEQDTTLVITRWEFAGVGYLTSGDATLALSAAARAREQRQAAREAA
jgi:hypothetical protein